MKDIKMFVRYLYTFFAVNVAKLFAMILAPVAALFVYKDAAGVSQLKWKWIYTHDTGIDAWWLDTVWTDEKDRNKPLRKGREPEDFDKSVLLRYACRVWWIWRNPAYAFSHRLGYDQSGMTITKHRDEGVLWDSGHPNTSYWTAVNAKGQKAFLFQKQIYYGKSDWCLEIYLGWKLHRKDPDKVCMSVVRISPFRKYSKQG